VTSEKEFCKNPTSKDTITTIYSESYDSIGGHKHSLDQDAFREFLSHAEDRVDLSHLDHVIVLNDRHLKRILIRYFAYYHRWRTHLSLEMDSPESRTVQPPALGKVVQFPEVGGLHHHYERLAA